jgi:hypothetical protein
VRRARGRHGRLSGLLAFSLGLRFALELCALAALAVGGASIHWALGIAAPVLAAVVWGMFVAPKATRPVSEGARWAIELMVFGFATAALVVAGAPVLAVVFAVAAVLNGAVVRALEPAA